MKEIRGLDEAIYEMRKYVTDAVLNEQMFTDILFCKVLSINPLKLKIENNDNLILEKNIILCEKVTDHGVEMVADPTHNTESASSVSGSDADFRSHAHEYKGGRFLIKYGLKEEDRVAVLKFSCGQRYLVLDRVN